jgi:hypothetical protein
MLIDVRAMKSQSREVLRSVRASACWSTHSSAGSSPIFSLL